MGDVLRFKRVRNVRIKGAIRSALTDANSAIGDPAAAVVVVIGRDKNYSIRMVREDGFLTDFDVYSRASGVIDKIRSELVD